jgi:hypothetical protein
MEIKGIQSLDIEDRPDGTYGIHVVYTEDFVKILKKALKKQRITKKDVLSFIQEALETL